ncbi:MAG: 2-oxoacid:ferredoxin oxidoreductase subunit beta [Deltaproteobacteria bacterium]|nr:MAG: 2-oxoacid:ferredoxin oxidoreductase subunit beta [Deltaproteobacteria bacterium]
MPIKDYIRERFFPHLWCPGCGHGIVMSNLIRAVEKLGLDKNEVVVVSGIGCSSRMPGYLDFHTMHTLHGRALAFATGVKMGRPDLTVIVPMGDGDAMAIGGNHFIHACRRNIDLTAVIMNNNIYGMTGGQFSPTTPHGKRGTTAPFGSIDNAFDTVNLARGAGATFVARTTTYHAKEMITILRKAILHRGFSVVEVLSQCPTYYGRKNRLGDAVDMMRQYREGTVRIGSGDAEADGGRIERGIFIDRDLPEYTSLYKEETRRAGEAPEDAPPPSRGGG